MPEYSDQDIQEIKEKARRQGLEEGRMPLRIAKLLAAVVLAMLGLVTLIWPEWFISGAPVPPTQAETTISGSADLIQLSRIQVDDLATAMIDELALGMLGDEFWLMFLRALFFMGMVALILSWALDLSNKNRVQGSWKDRGSFIVSESIIVFLAVFLLPVGIFLYAYFEGTSPTRVEAARGLVALAKDERQKTIAAEAARGLAEQKLDAVTARTERTLTGQIERVDETLDGVRDTVAQTISGYVELGAVLTPMALRLDCSNIDRSTPYKFKLYFGDDIRIEAGEPGRMTESEFNFAQHRILAEDTVFFVNRLRQQFAFYAEKDGREQETPVYRMAGPAVGSALLEPAVSNFRWAKGLGETTFVKKRSGAVRSDVPDIDDGFAEGPRGVRAFGDVQPLFGVMIRSRDRNAIGDLQREIVAPSAQKVVEVSVASAMTLCEDVTRQLLEAARPEVARNPE